MSDDIEQWLDTLEPTGPGRDARHMRRIIAVVETGAGESELSEAVNTAREAGDPWSMIAVALGVSVDDARERFERTLGTD